MWSLLSYAFFPNPLTAASNKQDLRRDTSSGVSVESDPRNPSHLIGTYLLLSFLLLLNLFNPFLSESYFDQRRDCVYYVVAKQ